ncbi:MAG: hypothetical protein NE330_07190 [Lentisphaeraceae bacterium]|nr:hypothetical protein [Lentisphaeraceae bacterium]
MADTNFKPQQIHASNISANIAEALEARVKDPLWFLSRQWQTGEFEAESGGRPASISIKSNDYAFKSVAFEKKNEKTKKTETITRDLKQSDPLEAVVEAEDENGDSPTWRHEALEYSFEVNAEGYNFKVNDYEGKNLDWHNFECSKTLRGAKAVTNNQRIVPTQLHFDGAPDPRWWRFEEGDSYFDSPEDPEPNALSLMLPEFFYADIKNWYITPMFMKAGSIRKITELTVIDSFGVLTNLDPATSKRKNDDWGMFVVDGKSNFDGRYILAPNIALDILHNDDVEEVRFARDEDANLVWAIENRIVNDEGESVTPESEIIGDAGVLSSTLRSFKLKSPTERSWIPYVPRTKKVDGVIGDMYLRRARTDENAVGDNHQYRSKIVSESIRINEEEIPSTGLKVRRVHRYTRDSEGNAHFWIGREKDVTGRMSRPGIEFDYLEEQGSN